MEAISKIDQLHRQSSTKENLFKMPDFKSKEEELGFYLNLQNPRTGLFMDESFPYRTWHGPTENVLLHIELLAEEIGQPVKLKYPLKYLDKIKTPEKLTEFLEGSSVVGLIGSKLPQTSFHYIRDYLPWPGTKQIALKCGSLKSTENIDDAIYEIEQPMKL